jgi:hypothetical protein
MSLKAFHVFFITLAILMTLCFGARALWIFRDAGGVSWLATGVLALMFGAALTAYEVWFVRKVKRLGF